jgi:hypothetical protein
MTWRDPSLTDVNLAAVNVYHMGLERHFRLYKSTTNIPSAYILWFARGVMGLKEI